MKKVFTKKFDCITKYFKSSSRLVGAVALVAGLTSIAFFQNCSQTPGIEFSLSSKLMAESTYTGRYCSTMLDDGTRSWKFLFIIDMSRSNLGSFTGDKWDFSKATDKDGARFDQIQQFITGCGATNPKNQYQVMVFSNEAGVPNGNGISKASLSCTAPFGTGAVAQTKLAAAKAQQASEVNFWTTYTTRPWDASGQNIFDSGTLFMMDTHYSTALKCASQTLVQDRATNPTDNSNYVVFFLTDGKPYDVNDACERAADKFDCYGKQASDATVNMAIDAKVANQSMQMFPIYYGAKIPGDQAQALKVLNRMARVTGTTGALSVDDIANSPGGSGGFVQALCSLSQAARKIDYRKEVLSIVNLTAKAVGEKLIPDSDMDGIPDEYELKYGYDIQNRRTFGMLDSICQQLGGSKLCPQAKAKSNCTGKLNNLGLNDCDLDLLGVSNSFNLPFRQFGIDTDRDGVADVIEIVRGTNPTLMDSSDDMDNDGFTNQAEINSGTDPMRPVNVARDLQMIYTESSVPTADFCPNGSEAWQFKIDQLPVVLTKSSSAKETPIEAVSKSTESNFDFSHAENENLILVTYKLVPSNAAAAAPQLWGAILKANIGISRDGKYQPSYNNLQPSDFFFIGETK